MASLVLAPIVTLIVLGTAPAGAIDFDTDVLPVLTRSGCNTGACHGAAIGQGGFRLSLLGERPADDYISMIQELEGRRANLAHPEKSLLLTKAGELLEHGGGLRLEVDSPGYRLLHDWLAAAVRRLQLRKLASFRVEPQRKLLVKVGETVEVHVWAEFDDGSKREVTPWAVIAPNDAAAAQVDAAGRITLLRRGQTTLIVRYLDRVAAVQITLPLADEPIDLSRQPRHNFIDEAILATLADLRLPVAQQAGDAAFLRRLRLDLTGTLPAPDEVREFLADGSPDKRAQLVERLFATPEFADFWSHKWGNLLRINSNRMDQQGVRAFHSWLREQMVRNTPLDAISRELLTSLGDAHTIGPANFARATGGARDQAEHVSQLFLGARLGCANCHNHPLDRWSQDDYHGLAAIFARLERGPQVRLSTRGEVTHPRTGEAAVPRLPGVRFLAVGDDGRDALARWVTSPENPHFARVCVNRLWAEMFGRGLVEPVDDLRDTNPATHPALLERLAADFVSHGFDQRHTLRLIAISAAYGRSHELEVSRDQPGAPPIRDDRFYSTFTPKPLPPEVLLDAVVNVTGVAERFGELPDDVRAIALADSKTPSQALDVLGRCSRDGPCQPASATAGLPTKLHLINGPLINAKIASPAGRLHRLLAGGGQRSAGGSPAQTGEPPVLRTASRSDNEILEEFYLRALGRFPSRDERAHWQRVLAPAADENARRQLWEDLLWGLLNCREFTTNQ